MSAIPDENEADNPQNIEKQEESVHLVNGDVNSQNGEVEAQNSNTNTKHVPKDADIKETDESAIELKTERQNHEIVLIEYERVKDELLKLQNEYKSSLEREKELCEKLKTIQSEEDNKVTQLTKVNEDLREQFNNLLDELNGKKDELKE